MAIKNLIIDNKDKLSNNLIRKLRGVGGSSTNEIPGYLIGQLGRNENFSTDDISGQEILHIAIDKITEIQKQIGGRFILVDCITKLLDFYNSFDFIKIGKKNNLNILVKLIYK
ncbi:MAG: hypothetical protein ACPKM0_11955 [Pleomorphochaeta sp.]